MTDQLHVGVAGAAGAFGRKHLAALQAIPDIRVVWLVDNDRSALSDFAEEHQTAQVSTDLKQALADPKLDAMILATPTPLHATQAMQCLQAGKHVLVEIPMADSLADAQALVDTQKKTGLVAMAGHTRRFNPGHRWLHQRFLQGELVLQHLEVQTRFFRRSNTNALGEPRSWTDHLLWHHACHTVDLFHFQTGAAPQAIQALQGPPHPQLNIAMDMNIALKSPAGALCSLALSFNNDGPLGTDFRYICDHGTYIARYDDLTDGYGNPVDLSGIEGPKNGLEAEQREFFRAIREQEEPESSVAHCLPTMRTLHRLEQS